MANLPAISNITEYRGTEQIDGSLYYTSSTELLQDVTIRDYRYWTVLLGIFVLMTLFGNILVVLAVVRVRSLQSVTNYLILSLAIADIFVGVLVMPLAVYVEVSQ